jgi:hypothetical protein
MIENRKPTAMLQLGIKPNYPGEYGIEVASIEQKYFNVSFDIYNLGTHRKLMSGKLVAVD